MSTRWQLFHPIMWLWAPDNGYSIQSCDYKHQMTVIPSNHVTMSTRWRLFHPIIYLWAQDDGYARVTSCALSSRHTFSNCSNFPSAPTYGVNYISIKRDSRILHFLDIWLLLISKLLTHGFTSVILKSSLRTVYVGHHELVDSYELSVLQMTQDLLLSLS